MNAGDKDRPMPAPEGDAAPPSNDRRHALRVLAAAAGGAALAALPLAGASAPAAEPKPDEHKRAKHVPRWGMVIDLDKCTGCAGCSVACSAENNVPRGTPETAGQARGIYWMDMITKVSGSYPDLHSEIMPVPCMHCDDAPCVKVCPVGATYVNEEGIVAQIWDRCIGCRYCQAACPYSRRYFNWGEPSWPEHERAHLNPDVATRPIGVVEKCTFCHHRIRAARAKAKSDGRDLTDADVQHLPACAQACPARAITFGDLGNPESEVAQLSKLPRAERLLEDLGANPKVFYLKETKWRD